MVSIPKLLAAVSYCPLTGDFCWTDVVRGGALLGRLAGSIEKHGYVVLSIDGERCKAHRAAWLFVHGKWPAGVIDHINGNRTDNRISNLRCVSARQNRENQRVARSDSSTGLLGVTPVGKRFRAVIRVDGRHRYFGVYDSAAEAHEAALAAKREMHNAFAG